MKQTSMNFGAIKDTVYRYSGRKLTQENSGDITVLNAFLTEVKKNPLLKKQYLIYKNFEEGYCKKESLAERYINQNLKLLEGCSWNDIVDLNKNIRYSLLEQAHVEGQKGKEDFYEAIHTLIKSQTQPGFVDISKSQDAYDFLVQHLLIPKNKEEKKSDLGENEYPKFLSWKFITEMAVNNFNQRYSHLNNSEKFLLKVLLSPEENKKNYFIDLKTESLQNLENVLTNYKNNEIVQDSLNKFVDKISKMDENSLSGSDLDDAIIHLVELKDLIEEQ
jgi:hypothetical protein